MFKRLFREGKYFRNGDVSLRILENGLHVSRLGISVQSKIFPKAIQRTRVKRLIREVFRRNKANLKGAWDIIIRPKNLELVRLGYNSIEKNILSIFQKAGILE